LSDKSKSQPLIFVSNYPYSKGSILIPKNIWRPPRATLIRHYQA
jgi:hypothetical protein